MKGNMIIKSIYELNTKHWQHKLGTIGEVVTDADDVAQCYEIIFKTQKGTVVFNPNLGWDVMEYLGKPLNLVESKMKPTLLKALNQQEPRAKALSAVFSYGTAEDFANGHLTVEIEYELKLNNETYTTGEITL